jgi:hypothetical protein
MSDDAVALRERSLRVPLNESQKRKLGDWMKSKKGVRPTCVSCGANDWGAGELVFTPVLSSLRGRRLRIRTCRWCNSCAPTAAT